MPTEHEDFSQATPIIELAQKNDSPQDIFKRFRDSSDWPKRFSDKLQQKKDCLFHFFSWTRETINLLPPEDIDHFIKYIKDQDQVSLEKNDIWPQLTIVDDPDREWLDGTKEWHNEEGELHRLDGPAYETPNGYEYYFIEGKKLTEEEFYVHTESTIERNKQ